MTLLGQSPSQKPRTRFGYNQYDNVQRSIVKSRPFIKTLVKLSNFKEKLRFVRRKIRSVCKNGKLATTYFAV